MALISSTDFYINVPALPKDEFELYSTTLYDQWELYVQTILELEDYSLSLQVEEGSVRAIGKIGVGLYFLYIGIGQYGSFVSGLETIHKQVNDAGKYFSEKASEPFNVKEYKPKVNRRGESLTKLKALFRKVQSKKISVEQAMREAESFLGDETEDFPQFMTALEGELLKSPLFPEQVQLPFEEELIQGLVNDNRINKKSEPNKPKTPIPVSEHYLVEVWRDSRKSKRNVKVTSL